MTAPRKRGIGKPPPGKVVAQWGDDPETRREWDRIRCSPLTDEELWEACQAYFPESILPLAQARLLELIDAAAQWNGQPGERRPGRPSKGIGAEVEELVPVFGERLARSLVARRRKTMYARVADLHRRWKRLPKHKGGQNPAI